MVLVGRDGCVAQMVNNNYITKRFTALGLRLHEAAQMRGLS